MRIADRLIDLQTGEVEHGPETRRLAPKVVATLAVLCEHAGEVVAKDVLIERVWPDAFVTDDGLWHAIAELRRLFDDDPKSPRVIETLPRLGYRLIAPVTTPPSDPPMPDTLPTASTGGDNRPDRQPSPGFRGSLALVAVLALAVAVSSWAVLLRTTENVDQNLDQDRLQRGLDAFARYTAGSNEQAIELLEAEVDEHPTSARARAALADAYAFKGLYYTTERWWRTRALTEALAAVELDPTLAEAHKALGVARFANWDRVGAVAAYRRAIELRPTFHQAINNLALIEGEAGELAAAAAGFTRAVELVGDDAGYRTNLAAMWRLLGFADRARAELEQAERHASDAAQVAAAAWQRVLVDLEHGAHDAARVRLAAALDRAPRDVELATHAAEVALYLGEPWRAAEILDRLDRPWGGPRDVRTAALHLAAGTALGDRPTELARDTLKAIPPTAARSGRHQATDRAIAHLLLGDPASALDWLESLVDDAGYRDRFSLAHDPVFAELHDEPRFQALLARIDRRVAAQRALWFETVGESR